MDKQSVSLVWDFLKNGQYKLAEKNITQLIETHPKNCSYLNLLAIIYVSQKKFNDSIIVLNKIIEISPEFIDAYINLGNIYNDLNQLEKSLYYFKKAISINSSHTAAQFNLADILDKQDKFDESVQIYENLISNDPSNIDYLTNYSRNLIKTENFVRANNILKKVLKLDPSNTKAIINLGVIQKEKGNFNKAVQYFKKALAIEPGLSEAYYNLGTVQEKQENFTEAISSFEKAIKINPIFAKAHYNLGCVFEKIGQKNNALIKYKIAVKCKPYYTKALFNLARVQLATDDFKSGWIGHEQRKNGIKNAYVSLGIQLDQIWNGSKLKGPLVVLGEQGIGDEILYSSIFRDLENHHSGLIITANSRLIPIMQRSFPNVKFIGRHDHDYINKNILSKYMHIFAGSLGKIFRNSLYDFKDNKNPWLFSCPERYEEFAGKLSYLKKIKVGISWKASGVKSKDRNISLLKLASFFPKKHFEIINLQYGDINFDKKDFEKKERRKLVYFEDLDYKNDLDGIAALICNCDLVVTVGNAVAHFAGALGKYVWTLVPTDSQWWWHYSRKESLWYPNLKIFRQKNRENWDYVFKLLAKEVKLQYS